MIQTVGETAAVDVVAGAVAGPLTRKETVAESLQWDGSERLMVHELDRTATVDEAVSVG